jgi:hypothetical protein
LPYVGEHALGPSAVMTLPTSKRKYAILKQPSCSTASSTLLASLVGLNPSTFPLAKILGDNWFPQPCYMLSEQKMLMYFRNFTPRSQAADDY